ncbi:MAG: murein biosynthesis integral membrane protein MurJ [Anaerolineae bacterium]|nr:murein biosynthesis integral membrane protein MurJ [Anaerolineae bacterium]NIN93820.1 murein biosynthesis integral membrane protein MurJ [Anaerolineae bacterium]NIQ76855.1 murein biosynthesis integral membrane protein MurJ [Anaerolineae bacterium]
MNRGAALVAGPPRDEATSQAAEGAGIAQAATFVALGNVSSRVLGLIRETVISHLFGATGLVSAFRVAGIVPTMIYDLLVGGMISAALVPVFSDYAEQQDRQEMWRLASTLFTVVAMIFALIVLALELAAPAVAWLLGGGFHPSLLAVTTTLTRLIVPAVAFLGLSGVTTGLLYANKRFVYPAFGASVFNAGIIVAMLLLADRAGIASLSLGVLLGSILQLAIQVPGLRGLQFSFSLDFSHPGLRRIGRLYLPVALGLVVSQVAIALDRNLASRTGEQSIAWMQNATTLIQLPLGLVAVAVSTAILPSLSRLASAGDLVGYRRTLGTGLRTVVFFMVPATVGLLVLATPVIALLFEHGAFQPYDTERTAQALRIYLIGVSFAAIDQVLIFAFYARKDTKTPVLVGVLAVFIYLVVALIWIVPLGMLGLVLANSVQLTSHALVMLYLAHRHFDGLRGQALTQTVLKVLIASGLMGAVVYLSLPFLATIAAQVSTWGELLIVLGAGVLGVVSYALLAWALGIEEIRRVRELIRTGWATRVRRGPS